ncbi:MAG: hypothetical protein C5B59_08985 [Bacteroidetes bacterium]|nr:MAG: hypothetical protein C5B59_08985 [Bacteroidota bacterium]
MVANEKDIIHHIHRQFATLAELANKSTVSFNKIQVHRFRVQTKKLRAFLRLLQANPSQKKKLKIPRKIKKIYEVAGEIRNIQNHRSWIHDYFQNKKIPKTYLAMLRKKLDENKQEMRDKSHGEIFFNKERKEIIHRLARIKDQSCIDTFFEEKKQTIGTILAEEKSDAVLHALRKTLKDLDYNKKWLSQSSEFNEWKSEFVMKDLIDLLGSHQDFTIHEIFLSADETAQLNGTDKMLIEEAYRAASENKATIKEKILLKLASFETLESSHYFH